MFPAILIAGLTGLLNPSPSLQFAPCPGYKDQSGEPLDFVASITGPHSYLVHFHMIAREMSGKTVFIRLRCLPADGNGRTVLHTSLKEVKIENNEEAWAVFMDALRFEGKARDNVVYHLDLGLRDPESVDDFKVLNSFAWKIDKDEVMKETPRGPIEYRELEITAEGSFRVKTKTRSWVMARLVRLGIQPIVDVKTGPDTLKRIK